LEKNTARHNETGVLFNDGSTGNTLTENRIRNNELGFLAWDGSSGNTVRENSFCHNGFDMWNSPDSEPTYYIDNKVCGGGS
jgi:parallel beta-helix repeat protein